MPATPAWLGAFEAVLNRSIGQSAQATALARRLNDTSLSIEIEGMLGIRATVCAGRLALLAADGPEADAAISGSALALLELFRGAGGAAGGASKERARVQIRGDAEIAGRYRELLALARPDFEEELSRVLGDVPARQLAQFTRAAFAWADKARRTAGENIAEYLQEESRDLVNKTELEEFLAGVDELREAADRAEARLARLEQRLKGAP
jgi:ubiquinone biosynthesis protein UbiJ